MVPLTPNSDMTPNTFLQKVIMLPMGQCSLYRHLYANGPFAEHCESPFSATVTLSVTLFHVPKKCLNITRQEHKSNGNVVIVFLNPLLHSSQ